MSELETVCGTHDERLLDTKHNPISLGECLSQIMLLLLAILLFLLGRESYFQHRIFAVSPRLLIEFQYEI